jgi:hypothetical protein
MDSRLPILFVHRTFVKPYNIQAEDWGLANILPGILESLNDWRKKDASHLSVAMM